MRIRVTQKDINLSEPGPRKCPIAQALQRRGYKNALVGLRKVTVGERSAMLPKEACAFMWDYDSYDIAEPFSFTLPRLK